MAKKTTQSPPPPPPGMAVYVAYQMRPGYWIERAGVLIKWSDSGGNTGNVKVRLDDGTIARFHSIHVRFTVERARGLAEDLSLRSVHVGSGPGGTTSLRAA